MWVGIAETFFHGQRWKVKVKCVNATTAEPDILTLWHQGITCSVNCAVVVYVFMCCLCGTVDDDDDDDGMSDWCKWCLMMHCVVARWQVRQTASIIIIILPVGTWTTASAPRSTPSVWRTLPMRSAFWRAWVHCRWTARLILVELSVQHHCSLRLRGCKCRHESDQATSTQPHPTWLWMTWERHWRSYRPRRPSITWLSMLSTCVHQSSRDPPVLETLR